jgi:ABC-2 type transport system permease protein
VSPAREISVIVQRELARSLRSTKGIILALLTLVFGVGAALIWISAQNYTHEKVGAEQAKLMRQEVMTATYDAATGAHLAQAPQVVLLMLLTTISFSSFFASFLGYDAVAADLQYRSVRYVTMRARRTSYITGKALGVFAVASVMTLGIHAISWVLVIARTDSGAWDTVSWGLRFWLLSLPISFAWSAMVTFMSSLVKTPILGLLLSVTGLFATWLTYVIARIKKLDALSYIHPGGFDRLLLSPELDDLIYGLGAGIGWGALFIVGAIVIFHRRDV